MLSPSLRKESSKKASISPMGMGASLTFVALLRNVSM